MASAKLSLLKMIRLRIASMIERHPPGQRASVLITVVINDQTYRELREHYSKSLRVGAGGKLMLDQYAIHVDENQVEGVRVIER